LFLFFCQIDISDSQGDVDSLGSYNIEPEDMSGSLTPDGSGLNVEDVAYSYDHTNDFPVSVEGNENLCLIFYYGQIELNFSILL
jgi:hypothetical protein